jgi:RNA polymerase sigma-70 factor (ECF subfamily)
MLVAWRGTNQELFFGNSSVHKSEYTQRAANHGGLVGSKMNLPAHISDADLLRLVLEGNDEAFTTLYRRWQGSIYRFAIHMGSSAANAEDVTQEAFLILMRQGGQYDSARGAFAAYLYGIVRNLVRRGLSKDQRYLTIDEDLEKKTSGASAARALEIDPLTNVSRDETVDSMRQAVLCLPGRYREVVVLCDLHEMSYAEVASVLGCSVGTVRSRLHRARALLLRKLNGAKRSQPSPTGGDIARCLA